MCPPIAEVHRPPAVVRAVARAACSRTTSRRSGARTTTRSSRAARATSRSAESNVTTDHDFIRRWVEARGGQPACVRGTGDGEDIGMLRIDFPGYSGEESLEPISWEDWFQKFDERGLAFLYQERTASGEPSRFNKLVRREKAEEGNGSRER